MSRNTSIGPEYNEPLPTNLRNLMDAFRIKNVTLADYLGVSGTAIGNYRKGTDKPDWKAIVKIADYFHVSTDYLLGREAPFFESPDLEEIGFSAEAEMALKSLSTSRALESDPTGFFHKTFDELNRFLSSPQFLVFFNLLSRAKGAASRTLLKLDDILQGTENITEADKELLRFRSVYATEEVKDGYMFARFQIDRQLHELLDDYFEDKKVGLLLKQLEQEMAAKRKNQATQKKTIGKTRKEARNGEHSEN